MMPQSDKSGRRGGATGKPSGGPKPGGPLTAKDSRHSPNKGGGTQGGAKKHIMPAMYKFKYPSLSSAYDSIGMNHIYPGKTGAGGGGQLGINFPDEKVQVSGRKGVKRTY